MILQMHADFVMGKVVSDITGNFRLANDSKVKGKEREFNGMVDVYVKTIKSDGFVGLYRGFVISCVGIFIYRGMYFGLYDSLKPILLVSCTTQDGGSRKRSLNCLYSFAG